MSDIATLPLKSIYIPVGAYTTTKLATTLTTLFATALAAGYIVNNVAVSVNDLRNNTLRFSYLPQSTLTALVFLKTSPARAVLGLPKKNYTGNINDLALLSKFVTFPNKVIYQVTNKDFSGNVTATDKGPVPTNVNIAPQLVASQFECDLDPEASVALFIPQLESHDEKSIENNIEPFTVFHNNGSQSAFRHCKTYVYRPIQSISKLDVSFLNIATGEPFDFQNRDHILTMRFTHGSVRSET
jgi:hypothetical protein